MDTLRRFETISDYNAFNRNETRHPLVSVVDLSKADPREGSRMYFGFYTICMAGIRMITRKEPWFFWRRDRWPV
jgi:AraC family transcriptional activator of pobA